MKQYNLIEEIEKRDPKFKYSKDRLNFSNPSNSFRMSEKASSVLLSSYFSFKFITESFNLYYDFIEPLLS